MRLIRVSGAAFPCGHDLQPRWGTFRQLATDNRRPIRDVIAGAEGPCPFSSPNRVFRPASFPPLALRSVQPVPREDLLSPSSTTTRAAPGSRMESCFPAPFRKSRQRDDIHEHHCNAARGRGGTDPGMRYAVEAIPSMSMRAFRNNCPHLSIAATPNPSIPHVFTRTVCRTV